MAPPWIPDEADAEEWDDDPEAPQERDLDDGDDETPTVPCPHCGQPVADFAERCPSCGDWIIPGPHRSRASRWLIVTAILAAAALLAWQLW